MNNIYLIGMPGCGKSTIAKILSDKLGMEYIDADIYLEDKFNKKIRDIFALEGEDVFRNMETQVISELTQKNNIIVSTGGGVVTRNRNKLPMKSSGKVVFIDSDPEFILKNSTLGGRPLLKDKSRIFDLYKTRIDLYRDFADVTAKNNSSIEDAVHTIINLL